MLASKHDSRTTKVNAGDSWYTLGWTNWEKEQANYMKGRETEIKKVIGAKLHINYKKSVAVCATSLKCRRPEEKQTAIAFLTKNDQRRPQVQIQQIQYSVRGKRMHVNGNFSF